MDHPSQHHPAAPKSDTYTAHVDGGARGNPGPAGFGVVIHDPNGTTVHRDIYPGGQQDTEVIVCTIRGGGHTWPSGPQYFPAILVGKTNHDINASEVIWDFFSHHARQECSLNPTVCNATEHPAM